MDIFSFNLCVVSFDSILTHLFFLLSWRVLESLLQRKAPKQEMTTSMLYCRNGVAVSALLHTYHIMWSHLTTTPFFTWPQNLQGAFCQSPVFTACVLSWEVAFYPNSPIQATFVENCSPWPLKKPTYCRPLDILSDQFPSRSSTQSGETSWSREDLGFYQTPSTSK